MYQFLVCVSRSVESCLVRAALLLGWWSDGRGSPADLLRPSDWFPRSHRPLTSPRDGEFSPPGRRCARLGLRTTPSRKAQLDDSVPGPSGRRARPRPAARVPSAGRARRRLWPGVGTAGTTGAAGSRWLRPGLDASATGARVRAGVDAATVRRLRSAAAGRLWVRRAVPDLREPGAVRHHGRTEERRVGKG